MIAIRCFAVPIFAVFVLNDVCRAQSPMFSHVETVWGNSWHNPDSVLVDTCSTSPTYGKLFLNGPFRVKFAYGSILPLDSVSVDSDLTVSWEVIDTSYDSIRSIFGNVEDQFGSFMLHKDFPDRSDTNVELSRVFSIHTTGSVSISIYDSKGNLIRLIDLLNCTAGQNQITWDGLDNRNAPVPSGAYFYEVRFNGETQTKQMVVIK